MNWALALASAALLILIHPGPDIAWLAFIALTPLLIATAREQSSGRRFLLGWTAGVAYWFVICNWIQFVLEVHGGMGRWGGWGSFLLFCMLKAIHLGVFAALAGWLAGRWWSPPAIAALWVGIERTHGTFGFAWLTLGNSGIDFPPLARIAPWLGVYGLSFLFALTAAAIASRNPRRLAWILAALIPLAMPPIPDSAATDSAAVVQPNLDERTEWTTLNAGETERRLLTLSLEEALKSKAKLVIWPESPGPFYYPSDPQFSQYVTDFARAAQVSFLFGTVAYAPSGAPLNSAVMLTPGGELIDRYDKMFLVPFGEFIPPLFGFVNKITREAGNFEAGTRVVTFPYGAHRLGTFICYESAFPHLVRKFALAGAGVLVNISNDGYFGRSYAREQHLKLVRMRALENHRWIVRSTNDGITAAIDPSGKVASRLEPFKQLSATLRFGYEKEPTFYTRHGDWFAWCCLALALPLAIVRARRHPKPAP